MLHQPRVHTSTEEVQKDVPVSAEACEDHNLVEVSGGSSNPEIDPTDCLMSSIMSYILYSYVIMYL